MLNTTDPLVTLVWLCSVEAVEKEVPKECAIKVFKTTLADFRNRSIYVKGDTRFFKDEFKKQNPRKIMKLWAEKEEINLRRFVNCYGYECG